MRIAHLATRTSVVHRLFQSPVTIGSDEHRTVCLDAAGVSELHGVFTFDRLSVEYVDLGSFTGSLIDGVAVAEAIERIVRALVAIGDRYSVLMHERIRAKPEDIDRVLAAPIRAVFLRGVDTGALRADIPLEILLELFGGCIASAIDLVGRRTTGLEDATAAATLLFLEGAATGR